jgi:hypothetical protein
MRPSGHLIFLMIAEGLSLNASGPNTVVDVEKKSI